MPFFCSRKDRHSFFCTGIFPTSYLSQYRNYYVKMAIILLKLYLILGCFLFSLRVLSNNNREMTLAYFVSTYEK